MAWENITVMKLQTLPKSSLSMAAAVIPKSGGDLTI